MTSVSYNIINVVKFNNDFTVAFKKMGIIKVKKNLDTSLIIIKTLEEAELLFKIINISRKNSNNNNSKINIEDTLDTTYLKKSIITYIFRLFIEENKTIHMEEVIRMDAKEYKNFATDKEICKIKDVFSIFYSREEESIDVTSSKSKYLLEPKIDILYIKRTCKTQ